MTHQFPLIEEIQYHDPNVIANHLRHMPYFTWLDSSTHHLRETDLNRFSFITFNPWEVIRWNSGDEGNPILALQKKHHQLKLDSVPGIPPFQGGMVGYFAYDLCHLIDHIPTPSQDFGRFPEVIVGMYDLVISFDHHQKKAWIISTGWPADNEFQRKSRATERLKFLSVCLSEITQKTEKDIQIVEPVEIRSNFKQSEYQQLVQRCKDYILAGDIFEVNISQSFSAKLPDGLSPFQLYCELRKINPAPFSAFLDFDDVVLVSASPERFVKCHDNQIETRPIKGTRPRGKNTVEDEKLAQELLSSEKDRAENIMIVDLMRNDLSRVCQDESVIVNQLCQLESFATVHHLVSVVTGTLSEDNDIFDLLLAAFPGGSITGAPKIRAMQIISELEPSRRGPYCGSIGYISHDGNADFSIVIRTFAIQDREVVFQTGGAIVSDSDPEAEYVETLDKAKAMINALKGRLVSS